MGTYCNALFTVFHNNHSNNNSEASIYKINCQNSSSGKLAENKKKTKPYL